MQKIISGLEYGAVNEKKNWIYFVFQKFFGNGNFATQALPLGTFETKSTGTFIPVWKLSFRIKANILLNTRNILLL